MKNDQLAIQSLIAKNKDNNQQVKRYQEIVGTEKMFIKNKEAVCFKVDQGVTVYGLYIRKGLFGWFVRGAYDFEWKEVIALNSVPVQYYFLTLEKSLLLNGIYDNNQVRSIQVDDEQPATLQLDETKVFSFMIVSKNPGQIQGFGKDGQRILDERIAKDRISKFF
ncbi:hypothetical protein [Paenibacillus albus]|uniref:Uncharacterized protein n=1 Tax=Paenibacillus albus TaxID=2495582 RepID=A0A3S9AAK4_9BACL|nr:hypothetical protein [Paenibacillus albus]AZN42734.1 hypothetical protein EJC50_25885 [Paenibacillus albus]